jgi:CRISPR/Cas system-associated endonuclease Cas1
MIRRLADLKQGKQLRAKLQETRSKLRKVTNIEMLIGLEGIATKTYYQGFAMRIKKEEFAYKERSKRCYGI